MSLRPTSDWPKSMLRRCSICGWQAGGLYPIKLEINGRDQDFNTCLRCVADEYSATNRVLGTMEPVE